MYPKKFWKRIKWKILLKRISRTVLKKVIKALWYWDKNRYIAQWNGTKSLGKDPLMYDQLIFTKYTTAIKERKENLFNSTRTIEKPKPKKKKIKILLLYFQTYIKIIPKLIILF